MLAVDQNYRRRGIGKTKLSLVTEGPLSILPCGRRSHKLKKEWPEFAKPWEVGTGSLGGARFAECVVWDHVIFFFFF